jgi:hypothetical protein
MTVDMADPAGETTAVFETSAAPSIADADMNPSDYRPAPDDATLLAPSST